MQILTQVGVAISGGGPNVWSGLVKGHYLYVSVDGVGIRIYDISDLSSPVLKYTEPLTTPFSGISAQVFSEDKNILYVAIGRDNRLHVFDASVPETLTLMGQSGEPYVVGESISKQATINYPYVYVFCSQFGANRTCVYDITDPYNPFRSRILYYDPTYYPEQWGDKYGNYSLFPNGVGGWGIGPKDMASYVSGEPAGGNNYKTLSVVGDKFFLFGAVGGTASYGYHLYDLSSDPLNPTYVTSIDLGLGNVYHSRAIEDYLFVGHFTGFGGTIGISVYDVSDPLSPVYIAQSNDSISGVFLDIDDDYVYATGAANLGVRAYQNALIALFSATPLIAYPLEPIKFTSESLGIPSTYLWDFGDGATSTNENPSHVYTKMGKYTVSLTVTGVQGTDTLTKSDYIEILEAKSTANPTEGKAPLRVQFTYRDE